MVETSGRLFLGSRARGGGSKTQRAVQAAAASTPKITRQARDRARDTSQLGAGPCGQAWGADRRLDRDLDGFDAL